MAKGWVPQIVGQTSGVDDVGITAQRFAQFPAYLRHFETVGQAGAHEVIRRGADHLSLRAEAAQC